MILLTTGHLRSPRVHLYQYSNAFNELYFFLWLGVFTISEKPFHATLKMIPLTAGHLHLPRVHLYQYSEPEAAAAAAAAGMKIELSFLPVR